MNALFAISLFVFFCAIGIVFQERSPVKTVFFLIGFITNAAVFVWPQFFEVLLYGGSSGIPPAEITRMGWQMTALWVLQGVLYWVITEPAHNVINGEPINKADETKLPGYVAYQVTKYFHIEIGGNDNHFWGRVNLTNAIIKLIALGLTSFWAYTLFA